MHLRKALILFCIQFFYYLLTTFNYRAVATVHYTETFITDVAIAALVFMSIQRVAKAETLSERMSYIFGGAIGALVALWLSVWWFDA